MRIQHNIMALNSHRQLGNNNSAVSKSLEKLSSGYRINRAGDDAAGLAISEKMRAQIKGLTAATDNSQDAISLVQTAEGGLQEVHSMLNRMQELATKSSNGTYTDDVDRKALQDEVSALKDEINRIADSTNFNGINLLDGSMGVGTTGAADPSVAADATAHTGAFGWSISGTEGIEVTLATKASSGTKGVTASWAGSKLTLTIDAKKDEVITQADIDKAIAAASGAPEIAKDLKVTLDNDIKMGDNSAPQANISTLKSEKAKQASATNNGITVTATKAGDLHYNFEIKADANAAKGVTVLANGNVSVNLETGKTYSASDINQMLSGAGAELRVSFEGTKDSADLLFAAANVAGGKGLSAGGGIELQIGDTNDAWNQLELSISDMHVDSLGIGEIDISNREGAFAAISKIKDAINSVSTSRGKLGAIQNRLEHTINNLGVTTENITAAESRIRDVDMAKEMMEFTKNSVLMQSAQAMLAQANQQPQSILQLLQ